MSNETENISSVNDSTGLRSTTAVCFHFSDAYFDRDGNSTTPYAVTSALNAVMCLPAAFGNVLILVAIWRAAALHLPSKLLIFNLALTDFIIGLVVQPLFAVFAAKRATGFTDKSYCGPRLTYHLIASTMTAVSLLTATAISLDRYVALRSHLRYRQIVSAKRVVLVLVIIWLFSGTWASTWILENRLYHPMVIVALCILLPITTALYVGIFRMLRRQERRVKTAPNGAFHHNRISNIKRRRRSVTEMLYIYCVMLLCYLPYLCLNLNIRLTGRTAYKQTVLDLASTVVFMNSALNPIIYCWHLRTIRQAVRETLTTLHVFNVCVKTVTSSVDRSKTRRMSRVTVNKTTLSI